MTIMEKQLGDFGKLTPEELLEGWQERVHVLENAHYQACNSFGRRRVFLGVPATILSTVAGTSVFASMSSEVTTGVRLAVGLISVLVAVLTGMQTFLRYDERSGKHRAAGVQFGILRREIELERATRPPDTSIERLQAMKESLDALYKESPEIPQEIFDQERDAVEQRNAKRRVAKKPERETTSAPQQVPPRP
jgi:hypothetical protein